MSRVKIDTERVLELAFKAAADETGIACDREYEVEIVDAAQGEIELTIIPENRERV